jgi:hypothetical protein
MITGTKFQFCAIAALCVNAFPALPLLADGVKDWSSRFRFAATPTPVCTDPYPRSPLLMPPLPPPPPSILGIYPSNAQQETEREAQEQAGRLVRIAVQYGALGKRQQADAIVDSLQTMPGLATQEGKHLVGQMLVEEYAAVGLYEEAIAVLQKRQLFDQKVVSRFLRRVDEQTSPEARRIILKTLKTLVQDSQKVDLLLALVYSLAAVGLKQDSLDLLQRVTPIVQKLTPVSKITVNFPPGTPPEEQRRLIEGIRVIPDPQQTTHEFFGSDSEVVIRFNALLAGGCSRG